ncbi:MAG: sugar phosphate isomerase/epimerase [Bauldia sp.]|uniref:sugar phosphate isomerase/epimerase family protein n=1 Tax=Bauldia sp. TaxID=2575872 RepID=UPI001DD54BDE|nr:sugar phosphate isomerase/epimerase family protein [Bauldia sp.]MCB1496809.1 sugar phosphate isomerase/epimerase [Bauldia sp.]
MNPIEEVLVFSSTDDVVADNFVVPILAAPLDLLPGRAAELTFDGLEFLPNPDDVPDPGRLKSLLNDAGIGIGVINSGRLAVRGYALLHHDADRRRASIDVFKKLIDLAGALGARVGLGMARGDSTIAISGPELPGVMRDVFGEIAEHAEGAGTFVMLEPADPGYVAAILRVAEAAEQVREIASPGFSMMLDTYQLDQVEDTYEEGFEAAGGRATHIHLYDPKHWPPGVGPERLDWQRIRNAMERYGFRGSGSMVLAPSGDVDALAREAVAFIRNTLMGGSANA